MCYTGAHIWSLSASHALNILQEDLKEQQGDLVEALIKVISTQENYPLPGRPVREQVAQCLIHIYTYGETKTLYDTVQTLLKSLADTKSPLKDAHRV